VDVVNARDVVTRQVTDEVTEQTRAEMELVVRTLPRGRWHKRQLPNGVVIALRRHPIANAWNLAIVRETTPGSVTEQAKWESEVRRLQLAIGAGAWVRGDDLHQPEGNLAAAFVSR
jgi:hypothetical protein